LHNCGLSRVSSPAESLTQASLARAYGRRDWLALWAFLVPVSVFQVLPDWLLAELVGTLRFPDIGGPRLDDAMTLVMAGMWVPPLFLTLLFARG
jgi:hypothetical protein